MTRGRVADATLFGFDPMRNVEASLLRHHGQCRCKLAFGDGLSFRVSLSHRKYCVRQETPVPPKCANEIRVPPTPLMSDEFVSA